MTYAKLYDSARKHNMKVLLQRPQALRKVPATHMPDDPFRLVVRRQGADLAAFDGCNIDELARLAVTAVMARGIHL